MIESRDFWMNVTLLAIGTFAIRISLIALSARIRISSRVKELFSYIPAAILPAFIAPSVFFHQGHVSWLGNKERLVILVFAGAICYALRNTLATISFGLLALYLLTQAAV